MATCAKPIKFKSNINVLYHKPKSCKHGANLPRWNWIHFKGCPWSILNIQKLSCCYSISPQSKINQLQKWSPEKAISRRQWGTTLEYNFFPAGLFRLINTLNRAKSVKFGNKPPIQVQSINLYPNVSFLRGNENQIDARTAYYYIVCFCGDRKTIWLNDFLSALSQQQNKKRFSIYFN